MKNEVFAVLDKRTGTYKAPLYFPHKVEAIRFLEGIANNPQSDLGRWPLDYQVNKLGTFDTSTGRHEDSEIEEVCQIVDLIKKDTGNTVDVVEPIRKNG